ncbi:hypothetical protein QE152_g33893 [Popillia japonica]|uniref:Uncharacterized protein n=1 Tax=Popillia japonica TaxID=7064 RepID=A0AAW1IVB5_POPJA
MEFININYGGGGDDSGDYSSDGVAWNDADRPPRPNIRRQDDDGTMLTSGYGSTASEYPAAGRRRSSTIDIGLRTSSVR